MKTNCRFAHALLAMGVFAAAPAAFGQFFFVVKAQNFLQTALAAPAADVVAPFDFTAASAVANTVLTLPDNRTVPLTLFDDEYNFFAAFNTKAALDAAFPNGTYRMTAPGFPALSFNLSPDSFPVPPQITSVSNGAFNAGGVLVVNPALPLTINFNTFTTYATAGAAGHMEARVRGLQDDVEVTQEIASRAVFGIPMLPAPVTSVTFPANAMTAGRLYSVSVDFDTLITLDATTIPNGGILSLFQSTTSMVVAAQAPNTPAQAAPNIFQQPANQTAPAGSSVSFTVNANNLTVVRWYFNGREILYDGVKYVISPNSPTLTVNNLTAADAGTYRVRVAGPGGFLTSAPATLTIGAATPGGPTIARQPGPQTVAPGSSVVFSVAAGANSTYQWRLNGGPLTGTFTGNGGPTLILQGVTAQQAGLYSVIVSNGSASVTSSTAPLTVLPNAVDPGRLINLSILAPLGAGESMTLGTVLGGAGTSGGKPLLARAAGPSLAQLGVTGFLPDPTMTLINTSAGVTVATNNDWGGTPALSNAFSSVGAFAFINATSRDAAILQSSLAPGNYTVQVGDAGSGSGTVIAELYDATPGASFTPGTPRLINVSVLKQISAGDTLTAGFVIGGSSAKTVLIRAVGPTLGIAPFNIAGAMPDPQLTLINTSVSPQVTVATNNDWAGDGAINATSNRVGAFALSSPTSRDAVILITLPPGNYTAQVGPASGTAGGTAIVEVYEVP